MSSIRLATASARVAALAADAKAALDHALALPHPYPDALLLAYLADQLAAQATATYDRLNPDDLETDRD